MAWLKDTLNCMHNIIMIYEWDASKNAVNIAAGRPGFEAIYDFEWETAIITPSPRSGEFRTGSAWANRRQTLPCRVHDSGRSATHHQPAACK